MKTSALEWQSTSPILSRCHHFCAVDRGHHSILRVAFDGGIGKKNHSCHNHDYYTHLVVNLTIYMPRASVRSAKIFVFDVSFQLRVKKATCIVLGFHHYCWERFHEISLDSTSYEMSHKCFVTPLN